MRSRKTFFTIRVLFRPLMVKPEQSLLHVYDGWIAFHGRRVFQAGIQRISNQLRNRWMHAALCLQARVRDPDPSCIVRDEPLKQRNIQRIPLSVSTVAVQPVILDVRPELKMIADEDSMLYGGHECRQYVRLK